MASEDILAIVLGVVGFVGGSLAFFISLFPPKETEGRKKTVLLGISIVLTMLSAILAFLQQKTSSNARSINQQISLEYRNTREAAAPLADELHLSSDDVATIIREALSKLNELEAATRNEKRLNECEAASNEYASSLVGHSQLPQLTGSAPADPPETVLERAATRISALSSEVRQLTERVTALNDQPSPVCPSPTPDASTSCQWQSLSQRRLQELTEQLGNLSRDEHQRISVTYYDTKDGQILASNIALALQKANWRLSGPVKPSPGGETFGIAVYGNDTQAVQKIVSAIKSATGIDAIHASTHNEPTRSSGHAKAAEPQSTNSMPGSPSVPDFEIAIGCKPEPTTASPR